MTYPSPTTGNPVGLSFIIPKSSDDLSRRRGMMSSWAHASYGMMGRTPDFLNLTIMAMAAAGDFFGENRPEFKQNVINYYEFARENDLCMTHTLVNLQRNRAPSATSMNYSTDVALHVVKETDAGLVVRGPRVLATLGPLSDEIMVYPTRSSLLARDKDAHKYAFAFAVPCGIEGLKFICRESFDQDKSHFDHPLGSRFEEGDGRDRLFRRCARPLGTGLHVRRPAQVQQHVQRHRTVRAHRAPGRHQERRQVRVCGRYRQPDGLARIHRTDASGLVTQGMRSEGDGCSALIPPDAGGCGSRQLRQGDVDGSRAAAVGKITIVDGSWRHAMASLTRVCQAVGRSG